MMQAATKILTDETAFFTDVLAAINGVKEEPETSKSADSASLETLSLTARLNAMIAAGASFDVGAEDFQIMNADYLTGAERDFLTVNKTKTLCTLQQSALQKYLSLSGLQMFIDEMRERAAIISGGGTLEPPFEVLQPIVKEWFADMMKEMKK